MERITLYHRGTPVTHHSLLKGSFSIGSDPANDLVLAGEGVAERHLVVYRGDKGQWRAKLLGESGLGHVSKFCFDAIKTANESGVVVALASQCIWGRVNMNVYDTGRDLLNRGVVPLDDMFPETALVKLMWVLGQTSDPEKAKTLLKQNITGELSPRTLPEETSVDGGA